MFLYILLTCVNKLKGERTVSGIYNLLIGKRSSQTMQDSKAYGLDMFFGVNKDIDRQEFQTLIHQACNDQYVVIHNQQFPIITQKGQEYRHSYQGPQFSYFNGMKYHQSILEFERRLLLLIQTFTNLKMNNRSFIPIIDNTKTQMWVKKMFARTDQTVDDIVVALFKELEELLGFLSTIEAEIFTYRLTGGGTIGLTREQLRSKFNLTTNDVNIVLQHVYYFLFDHVKQENNRYPILFKCTEELESSTLITQSAKRTFQYLEQGFTLEEITKKRRLKMSTIQDHVVEAALVTPDFSIEEYVHIKDQRKIVKAADDLQTQRLKIIYQALDDKYSYFQLRLVLAVAHKLKQKGNQYARS